MLATRRLGVRVLCPNCAEEIRNTAKVCGFCGTRLTSPVAAVPDPEPEIAEPIVVTEEPEPEPATPKDSGSRWLLVVVIGGAAIAAAIIAVLVLSGGEDSPDDTVGIVGDADNPVIGTWQATDPDDGSTMWLFIDEAALPGRVDVTFYDDGASACDETEMPPAILEVGASYFEDEKQLVLDLGAFVCLYEGGEQSVSSIDVAFEHMRDTNILVSSVSGNEFRPATGTRETVIQR